MNKKILAIGTSLYKLHKHLGPPCRNPSTIFDSPEEIGLVAFPGGADIDPVLYGHKKHPTTYANLNRDLREVEIFTQAIKNGIPCVGVCRGGQLLTAMAGGYLYQNVSGHNMGHIAETHDGEKFKVTSCHHQMFGLPLPDKAKLLMWSEEKRSEHYSIQENEEANTPEYEVEGVFYPNIGSLAVQWHPEWMGEDSAGVKYYKKLLEKHIVPLMEKKHVFAMPQRYESK